MELKFLGGAREVGRSAVFVDTGREKLVLDYGVEVQEGKKPLKPPSGPDGVIITHAHLDHSGFAPALYCMGYQGKVFATSATFGLTSLLLEDSLKVQRKRGADPGFTEHDIERMGKRESVLEFGRPMEFGSSTIELFRAGHIPGAAAVSVDSRGGSVLYTGDIKFMPTDLMRGAEIGRRRVDVLVSESTYSYKDHPDRRKLRAQLLSIVETTCQNGGVALLPAFAVGRTQEILLLLKDSKFDFWLDGMGKTVNKIYLRYPEYVKSIKRLRQAVNRTHEVRNMHARSRALNGDIVVTTSGMLDGGPVLSYIDAVRNDPKSAILLTGYQVEGSNGRKILETGYMEFQGVSEKVNCEVLKFDFSAHAGHDELIAFAKGCSPEKVVLMHGDQREILAGDLKAEGFEVHLPKNGEKWTL